MKEEKLDRIIRKTVNDHFVSEPSNEFVDNVMVELGVKPIKSSLKTKPLRPKWGLIIMGILYLVILSSVFFIPGALSLNSTSYQLPQFKLPSLSEYLNISQGLSRMLILLIIGGWLLIIFDNYIKKLFIR
jgi:hypothetical protein